MTKKIDKLDSKNLEDINSQLKYNMGGVERLLTKEDVVKKLKGRVEEQQDFTFTVNEEQPIAGFFEADSSTGPIRLLLEQNEAVVLQDTGITTLDKLHIGAILGSFLGGSSTNELVKFISYLKPENIQGIEDNMLAYNI